MAQKSTEIDNSTDKSPIELTKKQSGWLHEIKSTFLTLFYSGMANAIGTVAGHPLDTVRVIIFAFDRVFLGSNANRGRNHSHRDDKIHMEE